MFAVEFTFENEHKYTLPATGSEEYVEGSWDAPPVGRNAEFVAGVVDEFVQTDIGCSLIYSCGDIVNVTVTRA